ncbi:MAG: hypothetical protein ACLP0J_25615 [Solirubrobacteraceae bacterium]
MLALLLMGMSAPTALAGDYHGIVVLDGSSFQGASGNDRVNNIGINYSSDFLNNEIWVFNTGRHYLGRGRYQQGIGRVWLPDSELSKLLLGRRTSSVRA